LAQLLVSLDCGIITRSFFEVGERRMLRATIEYRRANLIRDVALGAGILALIWTLTGWILEGASGTVVLTGLGLAVAAITLAILNNWRLGFYLFLLCILFEDLARKYMGNNMAIFFAKDVLVGLTYVSFFVALRRGQVESLRPRFLLPLSLFCWLGVVQVFNPSSPSLLYVLLGLKLYFYYVPLMFVSYALIQTEKELHHFLVISVALAGAIALLGVIQAIAGPTFLNPSVLAPELRTLGNLTRASPITGQMSYRPTSVFVSDGRFSSFLILAWILGFGAAGYLRLRVSRRQRVVLLSIGVTTAAIVLGGSRGALLWTAGSACVLAAAMLWGAPWKWRQGHRLVKVIRRTFLFAAIGIYFLILVFPSAVGARWAFYSESLSPWSPASELAERSWDYPIKNLMLAFSDPQWPYGHGIGTASLSVQYVSRLLGENPREIGVESGFGTLIVEMGILAPILWLAWSFVLLRSGWQVVRNLKATAYFPIGVSVLLFAALLLIAFTYMALSAYQNYVLNAFFWILVGVLFRLPTLTAANSAARVLTPSRAP